MMLITIVLLSVIGKLFERIIYETSTIFGKTFLIEMSGMIQTQI